MFLFFFPSNNRQLNCNISCTRNILGLIFAHGLRYALRINIHSECAFFFFFRINFTEHRCRSRMQLKIMYSSTQFQHEVFLIFRYCHNLFHPLTQQNTDFVELNTRNILINISTFDVNILFIDDFARPDQKVKLYGSVTIIPTSSIRIFAKTHYNDSQSAV